MIDLQSISGYTLSDLIGSGGFGSVYRATGPRGDCAVKVPYEPSSIDREITIASGLSHPNILPFSVVESADGVGCLVMPLCTVDLRSRLLNQDVPITECYSIIEQVGNALSYAHSMGVVHCDIKPSNIIFGSDGRVYVTDFGLAHSVRSESQNRSIDDYFSDVGTCNNQFSGKFVGTVFYTAPEARYRTSPLPLMDIYSFGVLIYDLIRDFDHPQLMSIAQKATQFHPQSRYQSVDELLDDLRAISPVQQTVEPASLVYQSLFDCLDEGRFCDAADIFICSFSSCISDDERALLLSKACEYVGELVISYKMIAEKHTDVCESFPLYEALYQLTSVMAPTIDDWLEKVDVDKFDPTPNLHYMPFLSNSMYFLLRYLKSLKVEEDTTLAREALDRGYRSFEIARSKIFGRAYLICACALDDVVAYGDILENSVEHKSLKTEILASSIKTYLVLIASRESFEEIPHACDIIDKAWNNIPDGEKEPFPLLILFLRHLKFYKAQKVEDKGPK